MPLPIVVVGAGIGGLAAAVELARSGENVVLVEARSEVGGKARAVEVAGRSIDVGPTVLTMRWVFDELFRRSLDDVLELRPLDRIARHSFVDGSMLDLYTDVARSADAVGAFAGPREAANYLRFADYSRRIAETVEKPFLRSPRPSLTSLLVGAGRVGLGALRQIDSHRTMWNALGSFFEDPRLRALFARYATYVGSSPLEAAATFNLIAHVEREGVVAIDGGISRLASALAELARSLGVTIHLGTRASVRRGPDGRVSAVELSRADASREVVPARAVILNADVATIAAGTFGAEVAKGVDAPPATRRSLSAMTWAIAGSAEGLELDHHNVFFSADYERETRMLWEARVMPDDPTVYLCAPDRERFFLIANAPARDFRRDDPEIAECERRVFSRLAKAGLNLRSKASRRMTPQDFAELAPGTAGAIYGEASHGAFASLNRPGSQTRIRGLYVASGSVHPGPGVPMAALSGRLAAEAARQDLASTSRSSRAGIVGSIWMR